ncbi:cysteine--tRNA ligase [Candidatus Beckwithbacteria bacterium CG10_big_fil_rev_8_21_14_0_10_34_10]|uniref:Cysteine--tRNA ligase n=1 Tax=Candidatus Beckwithbacteria bacterium CG10_big_fil_rev_8_21_14_0_10_34_10 TaxID=1974495 RepID=A0A2H0W8U1_9BACT|nr:MAG: cysteine--tRNA ligase [Candidatus Beckwithbacteria bacterium CG10_big_fil_rev_8_21_14_0_10_34_10]
MKIYNSLTKEIEQFKPINKREVKIYTCGPTVYDYAHVGNFRTYLLSDIVIRTLKYLNFKVKSVMNITDVGHLTSDADEGEDKLLKGAKREGKTAWEIAKIYEDIFKKEIKKMNFLEVDYLPRVTDHIKEQINLIKELERKSYTYKTSDGIYFDTSKFKNYQKLAQLDLKGLREGARVKVNPEKKNKHDFALWKFSPKNIKRDMEWNSPWGKGFPGWHIECSAMSMKYLGETIDLHLGGVDLKPVHHTNEIAQSEAATGKKFVNYWVHGEFLLIEGKKMSKSKGNYYALGQIEEKGIEPLALRYLFLTTHYRQSMNLTLEALKGCQTALNKLREKVISLKKEKDIKGVGNIAKTKALRKEFIKFISNDFNLPEALALMWQVLRSNLGASEKLNLVLDFDKVFGFNLSQVKAKKNLVKKEIQALALKRQALRQKGEFSKADRLRKEIEDKGYLIEDTSRGPAIKKK